MATRTNYLQERKSYVRHYGNFRGVDFSSDHTQINASRLAYCVNMYRDYQSGQGEALETVAGFRRRADFSVMYQVDDAGKITGNSNSIDGNTTIYGIHTCRFPDENGEARLHVLVHSGANLWLWKNYPDPLNVLETKVVSLSEATISVAAGIAGITEAGQTEGIVKEYCIPLGDDFKVEAIDAVSINEKDCKARSTLEQRDGKACLVINTSEIADADIDISFVRFSYYKKLLKMDDRLSGGMNLHKSQSFIFENKLYILDGSQYRVYDGKTVRPVVEDAYVPTTYRGLPAAGGNAEDLLANEKAQRNLLTARFRNTFIADGSTTVYRLMDRPIKEGSVKVWIDEELQSDKVLIDGEYHTVFTVDYEKGTVTFTTAPSEAKGEDLANVVIEAERVDVEDLRAAINACTLCTTFDSRVFLSGNPNEPNRVYWCGIDAESNRANASYFGILDYIDDGVGIAPITGLMCVSDTLMALKSDTQQDSAVYFHHASEQDNDVMPKIYPGTQGLSGLGCVGACCNFLDDPVFLSRLGVEGVAHLNIAAERANEHRSRLVDAKLVNTDLKNAVMEEWGGYLCVLSDGQIFLADSRQRYQDVTGGVQYEWYWLNEIGVWDDQYPEFQYAAELPEELVGITVMEDGRELELEIASAVPFSLEREVRSLIGAPANPPDKDGDATGTIRHTVVTVNIEGREVPEGVSYAYYEDVDQNENVVSRHAYYLGQQGNMTGGIFRKAVTLRSFDDNLYFGCVNGILCSFNFDLRNQDGELPPNAYHFDNRTILCGCATLMDNCGIPHLTKTTVKRSTVVKMKSFRASTAKLKIRTNKKPYAQIARLHANLFSFEDMDFSDFSFVTTEQSLFSVKEKEKQWIEKQHYVYSDEYLKPFALYSISFRYYIAGRFKE